VRRAEQEILPLTSHLSSACISRWREGNRHKPCTGGREHLTGGKIAITPRSGCIVPQEFENSPGAPRRQTVPRPTALSTRREPRPTDWSTGADAGAPLPLANKRAASRALLPLPTIESGALPLSRRMICPHIKLTNSETRNPPK